MYECAWYHNTFLVHLSLGNKVVLYCNQRAILATQNHLAKQAQNEDLIGRKSGTVKRSASKSHSVLSLKYLEYLAFFSQIFFFSKQIFDAHRLKA